MQNKILEGFSALQIQKCPENTLPDTKYLHSLNELYKIFEFHL